MRRGSGASGSSEAAGRRVGIARALSKLGICSRTQAVEWIAAGRVRLSGAVMRNPETPVRLGIDRIEIDGRPAAAKEKIYLVLNKERGLVTTASDEHGRATIYDSLPAHLSDRAERWIAPVGRLDKASEGLLLMTNDSEWAARITSPETHLDKVYHALVAAVADAALIDALRRGVENGGEVLRAKRASIIRGGQRNSWIEIVLDEGKNRQIRRMFESLGVETLRLVRVSIGPLALGNLRHGAVRRLTSEEKSLMDRALVKRSAG